MSGTDNLTGSDLQIRNGIDPGSFTKEEVAVAFVGVRSVSFRPDEYIPYPDAVGITQFRIRATQERTFVVNV